MPHIHARTRNPPISVRRIAYLMYYSPYIPRKTIFTQTRADAHTHTRAHRLTRANKAPAHLTPDGFMRVVRARRCGATKLSPDRTRAHRHRVRDASCIACIWRSIFKSRCRVRSPHCGQAYTALPAGQSSLWGRRREGWFGCVCNIASFCLFVSVTRHNGPRQYIIRSLDVFNMCAVCNRIVCKIYAQHT